MHGSLHPAHPTPLLCHTVSTRANKWLPESSKGGQGAEIIIRVTLQQGCLLLSVGQAGTEAFSDKGIPTKPSTCCLCTELPRQPAPSITKLASMAAVTRIAPQGASGDQRAPARKEEVRRDLGGFPWGPSCPVDTNPPPQTCTHSLLSWALVCGTGSVSLISNSLHLSGTSW